MAKRSDIGASRAARKQARARKRRAEARGLPLPAEPARSAVKAPAPFGHGRPKVSDAGRSGFALASKLAVFLVLLAGAVWLAARFRHGLLK